MAPSDRPADRPTGRPTDRSTLRSTHRTRPDGRDRHTVVLGGSIAGLLAARVLSEHARHVTIIDRDELPTGPQPRQGAPQDRHVHALLAGGQQSLEALLPGLTDELAAAGAPVGDMLADADVVFGGHRMCRARSGLPLVGASRPLIEGCIRARVLALENVDVAPPADAVGLRLSSDGRHVDGVRTVRRAAGSTGEVIDADTIVDATGRNSRLPDWLDELGLGAPECETVTVDIAYATRRYRLPTMAGETSLAHVIGPTPDRPRGGVLARVEDDVWLATLYDYAGDRPPLDPTGFEEFAAGIEPSDLAVGLADGTPIDDPVRYRFAANLRRRYDRSGDVPDGIVVMGDALSSFNPVYGQGITVAALQALELRRQLERRPRPTSRGIARALARTVRSPWELATGADLTLPSVDGARSRRHALVARWVARVQAAGARDPEVARAFLRVTGLVEPPGSLLRPAVIRRVVAAGRRADQPAPERAAGIDGTAQIGSNHRIDGSPPL